MKRVKSSAKHAGRNTVSVPGLSPIILPAPKPFRQTTVFEALKKRRTVRAIGDRKLSVQILSNLLWAAGGLNRRKGGPFNGPGRTAASASNSQEIDLYVTLKEGAYLYMPASHTLIPVAAGDLRPLALMREQGRTGAKAPARFVYVVDIAKFSKAGFQEPGLYDPETQSSYYSVDTGMIAANVYLAAAAQGVSAWFHHCNRTAITKALNLRPDQRALFGQTVGYPIIG
jgi:hypothetical protein